MAQRGRDRTPKVGPASGFAETPLQYTNHATLSRNTPLDSREGEVLLTFSVITVLPGPPNDSFGGVRHDTVARLAMSTRMAMALRDLLNRRVTAEDGTPEEDSDATEAEAADNEEEDN